MAAKEFGGIRAATSEDDETLVSHHLALWESYGLGARELKPDAANIIRSFIADARARFRFGAFIALDGHKAVGSVACQMHRLPYPDVVLPQFQRFGYIWHVFVAPDARRRGIARALVERALDHLRAAGCTKAVLHSSDAGVPLYEKLGFLVAKEMRLDLDAS